MPEKESVGNSPGGNVRYVDASAVLFHYTHLREKAGFQSGCGFCSKGLAAVLKDEPAIPLVQSGRVDEGGDSASSSTVGAGAAVRGKGNDNRDAGQGEPAPREDREGMERSNVWY